MSRRTTCKRKGCEETAAPDDDYCSALCAKVDHGVITLEDALRESRLSKRAKEKMSESESLDATRRSWASSGRTE